MVKAPLQATARFESLMRNDGVAAYSWKCPATIPKTMRACGKTNWAKGAPGEAFVVGTKCWSCGAVVEVRVEPE